MSVHFETDGALGLAHDIASRPQAALLPLGDALANEFEHGMATLRTGELFGGLEDYAGGGWREQREQA